LVTGDDPGDGRAGTHERPPTPEEVARAFIRDGGVVVFDEPDERRVRRRKTIVGAAIAVLVIAGAVVAFVILSTPKKSAPHSQPSALKTTSTTVAPTSTTTTTSAPLPANSAVTVDVLNASNALDLAGQTATGLRQIGFVVSGISDAPSVIATGDPSEIFYGPNGRPAAQALALSLNGPVSLVPSGLLTGNNVTLWAAGPQLTVKTTPATTTAP